MSVSTRRTAKTRPLSGLLMADGRREAVVVTAHEKRLVINVEADISAIPLARVRRDEGLNIRRTDNRDWRIRLDAVPPPDSWVHDLPILPQPSPLRRMLLVVLALLGLLAALLWLARDRVVQLAAPLLPHHVTEQIGRAYLAQMGPQCDGGPGNAALARLTARLLPAHGLPEPVSVTVVDSPDINAIALPGGHVALLRGIIDQAQSPDEIAAVLAHEIEHIAFQHPNQQLLKDSGPAVVARTLGSNAGDLADLTVLKKGGKAAEAEADGGAIALLQAAGISTRGAADFFRRQARGGEGFSDSHPSDRERARLYGDAVKWGAESGMSDADWQALKAVCRPTG
ncbi:M48 family metallopeptidase [Sandarakinorhabdus oryzae]|uniref:M48 family metallopeptidase n=1 Tax=Sandarakinorhabdus oryzae TaxID=2675220 RepID=UPI0018CC60F8|nr:M48 family metallopeptidase [Sandarakinorhabdus oryzae]